MANPLLERTSVQVILVIVVIAFLCNSSVSHTDQGLPWEVTLAGACTFGVVFSAYYAQKTEIALSIVAILGCLVPTYYVWNYEVPCNNWLLGSKYPLSTSRSALLGGVWRDAPNSSRFDAMLPGGLSVFDLSLFPPGVAITANTSEIYHSGVKLDDKITKEKTCAAHTPSAHAATECPRSRRHVPVLACMPTWRTGLLRTSLLASAAWETAPRRAARTHWPQVASSASASSLWASHSLSLSGGAGTTTCSSPRPAK